MIGQTTTKKTRLSPSDSYYKVHGENLRSQTVYMHSNKPSSHPYHHQPTRSHNTPPTSPLPFAWTSQYGGTPFVTLVKTRYYLTHYSTRPSSLAYTTTPTLQPLSQTNTLTTITTPLTWDPPPAINMIHNTLRQWYAELEIAHPSLNKTPQLSISKAHPSKQMDGHAVYACSSSTSPPHTKAAFPPSHTPNTTRDRSDDPTLNTSSPGN
jgi:hypothetical protein